MASLAPDTGLNENLPEQGPRQASSPPQAGRQRLSFAEIAARARALNARGATQKAQALLEQVLQARPDHHDALVELAILAGENEEHPRSEGLATRAIEARPTSAVAHNVLGVALARLGRHEESLAMLDRAIKLHPGYAEAHYNRGVVLQQAHRLEDAVASHDQALALQPGLAKAWRNRGLTLLALDRFKAALDSLNQAIELEPQELRALMGRAQARWRLGLTKDAVADYEHALEIKHDMPEIEWALALLLLQLGDYERGWQHYESRRKLKVYLDDPDGHHWDAHPLWSGREPLEGRTIVLHAEQGLGDALQFCRYVRAVAQRGARVLLDVPSELRPLLGQLEGVEALTDPTAPAAGIDFQCSLMSLPLALGARLDNIPLAEGYIRADPGKVAEWQSLLPVHHAPRIGLVWSGGFRADQPETHSINERRNIPLAVISRLNSLPFDFFSLQKGDPAESEIGGAEQTWWPAGNFHNYAAQLKDFSDTAALIANLDLVVSVDTSTAHLAAAMGKPTWILSRHDGCWRWLLDRDDSPWYHSVKLYRQGDGEPWAQVVDRLGRDLRERFRSFSPP